MPEPSQNPGGNQPQPGGEPNPNPNPNPAPAPATWRDALAPELKTAKTLDKFRGASWDEVGPQLASSYINLEKLHGGSIRIPSADAKPEEIAEFNRRLGVPEAPDKYGVTAAVPEGMPWDKGAEGEFLKVAHANGLTPKQVKGVLDWYVGAAQKSFDQQVQEGNEQAEKGWAALQERWGANTDRNVGLVQRAALEYGGAEFLQLLETPVPGIGKLGNHPAMNEFLFRLGDQALEHGFIKGDAVTLKNSDAKAEIANTLADKAHPYFDANDPKHAEAVQHMAELYAIAYPNER